MMKRILFPILTVLLCITVLSRCSVDDDWTSSKKTNFPAHIEEYGKTFAKELRRTVNNLNEMGVNYSDADNTPEFKERFYKDWYNANPVLTKSNVSIDQVGMSPEQFAEGFRNLTAIQIEFIQRIIEEGQQTDSYDELFRVLININEDIYARVPEIEQERLLYTTAVLYYGLSEIKSLEEKGQMFPTPMNNLHIPLIKTRNEGGGVGSSCRKFLASAWIIAVGEPTPLGEIVMAIVTVGYLLYEITVCIKEESGGTSGSSDDNNRYCQNEFVACMRPGNPWAFDNSGGWGKTMCELCRQQCIRDGFWHCPVSL